MLACEFCEIFKNTYFVKHLCMTASGYCQANINIEKSFLVPAYSFDWIKSEIKTKEIFKICLQV